jgi:hypothetical protein
MAGCRSLADNGQDNLSLAEWVHMVRLLFDRRAKPVYAGLWGVSWLAVAALLLLPIGGVPVPGGSDLVGHFLLFAAIAFAAVGFARAPAQLAWLAFVTIGLGVTLEYAQGFVPYRSSWVWLHATITRDAQRTGKGGPSASVEESSSSADPLCRRSYLPPSAVAAAT